MVDEKEFQEKAQKIGRLISGLNDISDTQARASAHDLLQLVMDLHGMAVEKMMEIIFSQGVCGTEIIERLGCDRITSSLLVLHGLHPDKVETRITRAVESVAAGLRKQDIELQLLGIEQGRVRIRATTGTHACKSTHAQARAAIEEAVYEAAPEIDTLVVEGLEGKDGGGFVGLDELIHAPAPAPLAGRRAGD